MKYVLVVYKLIYYEVPSYICFYQWTINGIDRYRQSSEKGVKFTSDVNSYNPEESPTELVPHIRNLQDKLSNTTIKQL